MLTELAVLTKEPRLTENTPTFSRFAPLATKHNLGLVACWLTVLASLLVMAVTGPKGVDVPQCWTAIQAVHLGGSPYRDGIAALQTFIQQHPQHDHMRAPLIYWYSPITIPLLKVLGWIPVGILLPLYVLALAAGYLMQLRAGYLMANKEEQRWLVWLLPFVAFFPGLLTDMTILSGNIAFLLYGPILWAAITGWKRERWFWFYVAVVVASFFKNPMLTLLAFPVLVGRRQWVPAIATAVISLVLFAIQPLIWPGPYQEYIAAIRMVFAWTCDYGIGPIGLLGKTLWDMHLPCSPATTIAFLFWALGLGTLLLVIRHRLPRTPICREMWLPLALLGALILSPRIKEYDIMPLTVPMLLLAVRGLRPLLRKLDGVGFVQIHPGWALAGASIAGFAVSNIIDALYGDWVPIELIVLLAVFALGLYAVLESARDLSTQGQKPLTIEECEAV